MRSPFHNKAADTVIYKAIEFEIQEAMDKIAARYKKKLIDIRKIEEDNKDGFKQFNIKSLTWDYLMQDPLIKKIADGLRENNIYNKKMVKQLFKDCFNEALNEVAYVELKDGKEKVKTKRMLLVEKIINKTIEGTITQNELRGLEVIRDSAGEKPVNEIIQKGFEAKVIDVNITEEKVGRVKDMLEALRNKKELDELTKDNSIGRDAQGRGDARIIEVDVSGQLKGVYNPNLLPNKQD